MPFIFRRTVPKCHPSSYSELRTSSFLLRGFALWIVSWGARDLPRCPFTLWGVSSNLGGARAKQDFFKPQHFDSFLVRLTLFTLLLLCFAVLSVGSQAICGLTPVKSLTSKPPSMLWNNWPLNNLKEWQDIHEQWQWNGEMFEYFNRCA